MTSYHRLLDEAIGKRPVSVVAREWGVPHWVLFDGLREAAEMPSAKYLALIAAGLGITVDTLVARAAQEPQPA